MPDDLKSQYQQDTKADISALQSAGVNTELFLEPWQGIKEYFKYLNTNSYY